MAQIVLLPLEAAVADAAVLHGHRRIEHGLQHLPLGCVIPDRSEGEPERVPDYRAPARA